MFEPEARNSTIRISPKGNNLVNAISNDRVPGPSMLLRRALPYWPTGGAVNAAVLNHSPMEGSASVNDCPGTTSARIVPLVPRLTSVKSPNTRGVNGEPEAMVQSPLHSQSP